MFCFLLNLLFLLTSSEVTNSDDWYCKVWIGMNLTWTPQPCIRKDGIHAFTDELGLCCWGIPQNKCILEENLSECVFSYFGTSYENNCGLCVSVDYAKSLFIYAIHRNEINNCGQFQEYYDKSPNSNVTWDFCHNTNKVCCYNGPHINEK